MTLEFPFSCGTKERVGGRAMMQPRATLELTLVGEKENLPHMHIDMAARSDYSTVKLTDEHGWFRRIWSIAAFCWTNAFLHEHLSRWGLWGRHVMQKCTISSRMMLMWLVLDLGFRHTAPTCGIQLCQSLITLPSSGKPDSIGRSGWASDTVEVDPNEQAATEDIKHKSKRCQCYTESASQ